MRCDLHVHSRHSGSVDLPILRHLSQESYSEPWEVYETAKARGMDLVTLTDHDTIDGALELAHLPDFIVGEEVTCAIGPRREIHLGVWDLDETGHERIAARRHDPEALFAWLAENDIPACINHPFSPLTGFREVQDLHRGFDGLNAVEVQNGMMPKATNEFARAEARRLRKAQVGGSDAHTLRGIGHSFTTVPRAESRDEFLCGLRDGFTVPTGSAGSYARLTKDVTEILFGAVSHNLANALKSREDFARFLAMMPLLPAIGFLPLITLASFVRESWGGRSIREAHSASLPSPDRYASAPLVARRLAIGGEQ
jgi:predicted metal-dependent phosphoesterase TrpH